MRVDKVILRAALSTLAAIVAMLAIMILALCFLFPATMMQMTYDLGMDGASIRYADRAYAYSGDVYYIAFATETAIGSDDYAQIETCGEKLLQDDEFESYCADRNAAVQSDGGYEQYVFSQICVAKYRQGEKTDAIDTAFTLVGNNAFPQNNAIAAVLVTALANGDSDTANTVKERMQNMNVPDADRGYFNKILKLGNE